MTYDQHVEQTVPNATAPGLPKQHTFEVWRTRHGIVQQRTTVHGRPVALVLQRSTYGHEVDSVLGFARLDDPDYVHDTTRFMHAASAIDFTFNWFYVDSRHIAYYTSALLPRRAKGVAFDFPRWGDRRYDWSGYVGFATHAHQVDPSRGYLVSWNNRQTRSWSAPDNIWAWGPVHRSQALEKRVRAAIAGGRRIDIQQAVGIMAGAATQDSRARYLLPDLLKVIGHDDALAPALRLLRAWERSGANRVDRDRDGSYEHQAAIDLFDTWHQHGDSSLAYDVMRGRLGDLVTRVPQLLDDHPRQGTGSAWLDAPWYSWVVKELGAELGRKVATPTAAEGVDTVGQLTYDKTQDDIVAQTAGVVGVRPIDWQNRPTFQQVVELTSHR